MKQPPALSSKFYLFPKCLFKIGLTHVYFLYCVTGKVISNKKEDLMRIIDQFNIQVDNPVAVLNQDTSRNFLNSKSPGDKYRVCPSFIDK